MGRAREAKRGEGETEAGGGAHLRDASQDPRGALERSSGQVVKIRAWYRITYFDYSHEGTAIEHGKDA